MRLSQNNKKSVIFDFYKTVEVSFENFIRKYYIVLIVLIFFASFLTKFLIIDECLGADYGMYLKWTDVLKGLDVVGRGLRYPPIYPLLLSVFLTFLDEIAALKVCAAFVFSFIVVPYFLMAKKIFGPSIPPILASLLITFNIFYSEMIAWGGNANILALAFLVAFIVFFLNSLEDVKSKKNILLAAFFMSLAIGSHYLLLAYLLMFFLLLLFFILLLHKKQGFKNHAKTIVIIWSMGLILCIPYITSYEHILDSYGHYLNSAAFYGAGFSLVDQIYILRKNLLDTIFIILGIAGILVLIKDGDKLPGLTLFALFLSGCLPIFFTLHMERWMYFWPIPVFLGLFIFIRKILSLKLRGFRRLVKSASVVCFTVLISTYIYTSVLYLYESVPYYNVLTPQLVEALKYIKSNTEPGSVIATTGPYRKEARGAGHCYGWWIEGFADRKCVATSYLRFLTYHDEREIAEKANILFSGTHTVFNDFVMVSETFPAGLGNPQISVSIGDFYEKLLFFADNETIITYGSKLNITLNYIKSEVACNINGDNRGIDLTYLYDFTVINKGMRILGDSVYISFKINQRSTNITKIFIPLFKSDFVDINSYHLKDDREITLEMTTSMGVHVKLNMMVNYDGVVETYFGSEPENKDKFVTFIFDDPSKETVIQFRFVLPKLVNIGSHQVRYSNAYNLIKQLSIDYIMININRPIEFEWFSHDGSFSKEFGNEEIAIFKVSFKHPEHL